MEPEDCIFCKIADGRIPAEFIHQDEVCVAFRDIDAQAPIHFLIIPTIHIDSLDKAADADSTVLGHLLLTAAVIARSLGFSDNGYRTVINTNKDGGQSVFHLHLHVLAGRPFVFPPG